MATIEAFKSYVSDVENKQGYSKPYAFGLGIRRSAKGKTLDVFFPHINFQEAYGTAALLIDVLNYFPGENGFSIVSKEHLQDAFNKFEAFHHEVDKHPNIKVIKTLLDEINQPKTYQEIDVIAYFLYNPNKAVETAEEGYFKLSCISQLKTKPHTLTLDGVFGKLNNIAWTNQGPILPEDLAEVRMKLTFKGENLVVSHVDKFPYLVNYFIPEGVRVASASQARLGAHLASGTTIMPAGYVNFNAGTLGNAMVEGRISGGVVVGADSDLGGGASIMGTLSGGNKNVISIGEKCLLGANSGTGISLGFGCTIEAGLYITAGSKIHLLNSQNIPCNIDGTPVNEGENIVKAMDLNGKDKLLFFRDSVTGKIICKPNPKTIELNASLHA